MATPEQAEETQVWAWGGCFVAAPVSLATLQNSSSKNNTNNNNHNSNNSNYNNITNSTNNNTNTNTTTNNNNDNDSNSNNSLRPYKISQKLEIWPHRPTSVPT